MSKNNVHDINMGDITEQPPMNTPVIKSSNATNIEPIPLATHESPNKIVINGKTYKKIALPFQEKLDPSDPRYHSIRTTMDRRGNRYGRMYGYLQVD